MIKWFKLIVWYFSKPSRGKYGIIQYCGKYGITQYWGKKYGIPQQNDVRIHIAILSSSCGILDIKDMSCQ